ncbi:hypothetical protein JKP88DRAFT_316824 [Tribonema minus]|uniref:PhoD-like phosphatase metallophosphatase domain-containing protein n=1 Tax=Tribonema minus TaxID=303371 RepID=A0A835Z5D0_9STRA|nr:hypothetical protein JKP88DRAFT_316824 [Tribonema minus]
MRTRLTTSGAVLERVNDAGGELSEHRQRMDEFLNFIGASKGDPRRQQNAIYSSHVLGPAGREVKVILLDTRTQRDPFLHLNIGLGFPAMQATWRLVTGQLCIGGHYGGDMLGEEQWAWLKGQLEGSTAAFHIIVSTVQVFTSCPIAESWGHFPAARRRLLQLLEATRPRGTMFISGDVHLAELISGIPPAPAIVEIEGNAKRHAPEREVLEVTSSGLTHSCAGRYGTTLCRTMLNHWNTHRPRAEAYYAWQNFGSARIDWGGCEEGCDGNGSKADVCAATATFNVHDAHGNIVLSTQRSSCRRWSLGEEGIDSVISVLEHGQCAQNRAFVASWRSSLLL